MTRRAARVTGWMVLAAAVVIAMPGCMTDPQAETPAQVRKQASMVSLMIGDAMGTGQLTEADLIQIVESNGGGYVTAITRSGRARTASERTTVHAVLGTSIASGNGSPDGPGKPVAETPAVLCYRFTVGYYPYQVWQADEACPRPRPGATGGFAATATAEAGRVLSAQNALVRLPRPALAQIRAAPLSLSQVQHVLGLDRHARQAAGILPLTAIAFAAGHGRAALALRLRAGGCIYLSLPDNPDGGGLPGPWLSPVLAPCTGAAALAASGYISNNPAAGG
jgi:hypothetical protein